MNILELLSKNRNMLLLILVTIAVVYLVLHMKKKNSEKEEDFAPLRQSIHEENMTERELQRTYGNYTGPSYKHSGACDYVNKGNVDLDPATLIPKPSQDEDDFNLHNPLTEMGAENYLTAGYSMGINTTSGSMKNPNLQLRSDPPVTIIDSGPWNQSTILPDTLRKSFDIGC